MEITSLLDMFIEMLINKGDSISTVEHTIESVFPFPDKQTLHKVTSTGSLSRHNSGHSVSATSPHNAGLPSLTSVQDDLSITVLILDVLIKQVSYYFQMLSFFETNKWFTSWLEMNEKKTDSGINLAIEIWKYNE